MSGLKELLSWRVEDPNAGDAVYEFTVVDKRGPDGMEGGAYADEMVGDSVLKILDAIFGRMTSMEILQDYPELKDAPDEEIIRVLDDDTDMFNNPGRGIQIKKNERTLVDYID